MASKDFFVHGSDVSLTLGSNIAALRTSRLLGRSTSALQNSFAKLSSGRRINTAADDAAGLAVSSRLNASARILAQGVRNINDGISALNIAEGGLQNLSSIVQRQQELAAQAANGSLSLTQRRALNAEASALTKQFNQIIATTRFNGNSLLDPTLSSIQIQSGVGAQNATSAYLNFGLQRNAGARTFQPAIPGLVENAMASIETGDINGDGILDGVYCKDGDINVEFGNGDGTFTSSTTYTQGGGRIRLVDVNNDGKLDIIAVNTSVAQASVNVGLNNGAGGFSFSVRTIGASGANTADVEVGDFNGDGSVDIAALDVNGSVWLMRNAGNGTFSTTSYTVFHTGLTGYALAAGDLNGDGKDDLVVGTGDGALSYLGSASGAFSYLSTLGSGDEAASVRLADMNNDGVLDLLLSGSASADSYNTGLYLGNTNGTFQSTASLLLDNAVSLMESADIDGDGYLDLVYYNANGGNTIVRINRQDGTFDSEISIAPLDVPTEYTFGDFNGDGVMDIISGSTTPQGGSVSLQNTVLSTQESFVNINTVAGARAAISNLSQVFDRINKALGSLGSSQSRLDTINRVVQATHDNYRSAESRIMDVDVAQETANLVRLQILQNAQSSFLSSVNQQPKLVLQLLKVD